MPYESTTVAKIVDDLNQSLFIPAFQRPFVWSPEQLVQLFNSLMKGYPISSFLFWRVDHANKHNWQIYKIAENFRFGEVHNELADTGGREIKLVLDGQQRLTSLLIGLRGSFTVKSKGKRWDNPEAWQRKRLYLDLLVDPAQTIAGDDFGEDIEPGYGFALLETAPASSAGALWIKVGDILDYADRGSFDDYKEKTLLTLGTTKNWVERETASRNLDRLHDMIWSEQIISYYTENEQDYDRVLGIFIRANEGGTKLSKSDLLLSMISSKWTDISAREEIYNFVDTINTRLSNQNNITKDFVMKSCLVLSDLDPVYQVKNFTNRNLEIMRLNWPHVQLAIRRTFNLINRFGIDRETLTSLNALLPIAYFLRKNDVDLLEGSSPFHVQNADRIRRWLITSLLIGVFGGTSDSTIALARGVIAQSMKNGEKDFPVAELNATLSRHLRRPAQLTGEALDAVMETTYGSKLTFLILSLLYDDQNWGTVPHQIDHIFPTARVNRKALSALNIPYSRVEQLLASVNRLGNLELLAGRENVEKTDQSFEDWIRSRDPSFLGRHHIPPDESLWSLLMLPAFVSQREAGIRKRLQTLQAGGADIEE